jgi:hypothetical protein
VREYFETLRSVMTDDAMSQFEVLECVPDFKE